MQLGCCPVSGARGWRPVLLPVLAIGPGGIALVTRVAMIDVAGRDFLMLLHAKGLSPTTIRLRHILRHILIPVVTILALRIGWVWGAVTFDYALTRPSLAQCGGDILQAWRGALHAIGAAQRQGCPVRPVVAAGPVRRGVCRCADAL